MSKILNFDSIKEESFKTDRYVWVEYTGHRIEPVKVVAQDSNSLTVSIIGVPTLYTFKKDEYLYHYRCWDYYPVEEERAKAVWGVTCPYCGDAMEIDYIVPGYTYICKRCHSRTPLKLSINEAYEAAMKRKTDK